MSAVAIVTGGAQGLGAAISRLLIESGYKVCIADVQEEKGENFTKELKAAYGNDKATFRLCDVSDYDDFTKLFAWTKEKLGKVDLLVNNAGILDEQNPERTFRVNTLGPMNGCRVALEQMGRSKGGVGGAVVNVASIVGFIYHHSAPAYVASKHAVVGMTRSFGTQFHFDQEGVLFHALCPILIDTDFVGYFKTESLVDGLDLSEAPIVTPEFAAKGVLKILNDKINGSTLAVTDEEGYFYVGIQNELKKHIRD